MSLLHFYLKKSQNIWGLITLFILFPFTFQAQDDENMVSFVADWDVGDTYNFRVTEVNTTWENGVKEIPDSSTFVLKFEVVESNDTSYTIKLSASNGYTNTEEGLPPELKEALDNFKELDVFYKTTELGEYLGIENWQEIRDQSMEIKEVFNKYFLEMGISEEDQSGLNVIFDIYSTKEGIEIGLFKGLKLFHLPLGRQFDKDEIYEDEGHVPQILGTDPIKANQKIYFESVDFETSHCVFRHKMEVDTEDAKKLILEVLKKMGLKDREIKQELKKAKYEFTDNNRLEYYYYPGIPVKIEMNRTTSLEMPYLKTKNVEKLTFEMMGLY